LPSIYFDLTREFNRDRSPSSAPVRPLRYHRPAIMSKDGDWILRETTAAWERVLAVLGRRGAIYRRASRSYLDEFRRIDRTGQTLDRAHQQVCELAGRLLPRTLGEG
jgi:hypothetical protein